MNEDEEHENPGYNIGEVWPSGENQDELLAFDKEAKPFRVGGICVGVAWPLKCNKCGGNEFHVAQGFRYTAIRCVKCEWECGIHSG